MARRPMTSICKNCGWKHVYLPPHKRHLLTEQHPHDKPYMLFFCPKCQSSKIKHREPNWLEKLMHTWHGA